MARVLIEKVFGSSTLYEILDVARDASESDIKRAYKRAALRFHPDKCPGDDSASERFQALSAAHAILSDASTREVYDRTGEMDHADVAQEAQEWYDYWRNLFPQVTVEQIQKFSDQYKGSDEERQDVLSAYVEGKGALQFIFDSVILADDEDEERFRSIIDAALAETSVPKFKAYTNKRKRSKKAEAMRKGEAKEAEEMMKQLREKENKRNGSKGSGGDDVASLIRSRQQSRAESFLSQLESKYKDMEEDEDIVDFTAKEENPRKGIRRGTGTKKSGKATRNGQRVREG